ncbi:hypothetical protein ACX27_10415 [Nostoc piscinale CENA21]|uniref:PEP-CTERM protein-sorting domain-containing protein n=1 Tax=Nostoc piscinale CENA21 TaxID=224013 RepID=A0A0M4SR04_9NOSO|nr:hypothetical protein [Nostoc piscinale]ALF53165.1 hypothetical protein ACX27_10415 [Nostoc piscinale CENA21]
MELITYAREVGNKYKNMNRIWRILMVSSLVGLGTLFNAKAQAASFEIDSTYTFLKTQSDTTYYNNVQTIAGNTKAISLADLGLEAGNTIRLTTSGAFNWSVWNPGQRNDMIGVFSASDTLLDSSFQQRVADAISLDAEDASKYGYTEANWTSNTLFDTTKQAGSTYDESKGAYMCNGETLSDVNRTCGQKTLFNGVFGILGEMTIKIPTNAKFLFLAVNDIFYSDNTEKMLVDITNAESVNNLSSAKYANDTTSVPEPSAVVGIAATLALALRMKSKKQVAN